MVVLLGILMFTDKFRKAKFTLILTDATNEFGHRPLRDGSLPVQIGSMCHISFGPITLGDGLAHLAYHLACKTAEISV